MDDVAEQQEIANEISDAISNPVGFGQDMDEVHRTAYILDPWPAEPMSRLFLVLAIWIVLYKLQSTAIKIKT